MFYKIVIFLSCMIMTVGYPTAVGSKQKTPKVYTIGNTTFVAVKDSLGARPKMDGTTKAAPDTMWGQIATPNYGSTSYSFMTYTTNPRCDSMKVYVNGTKTYTYNFTTTGFVTHKFTFTSQAITPQTVKFVMIYGDTLAGSYYLANLNLRQ